MLITVARKRGERRRVSSKGRWDWGGAREVVACWKVRWYLFSEGYRGYGEAVNRNRDGKTERRRQRIWYGGEGKEGD